ncbi:YuzB family protein [Microbacteriaceae bacterium 4G12]
MKKLIKPLIEFCVSNLANGAQRAREVLEKDSNLDVIEYGCLGYCGICYEGLYALVNGETVTGSTPDELVKNIYEYLEENPMF